MPSSVTLPPVFDICKASSFSNRFDREKHHHRQCATFSSGEGFQAFVERFNHLCSTNGGKSLLEMTSEKRWIKK
ncbi:MAG: hypothetical protein IIV82_01135, partial [Ruminococcus sp.]|nr:hypothetical protein [Ruminococcus sp.]